MNNVEGHYNHVRTSIQLDRELDYFFYVEIFYPTSDKSYPYWN